MELPNGLRELTAFAERWRLAISDLAANFGLATRAAIHRNLRALRARNRKKKTLSKQGLFLRTPRPATEPRDGPTRNFHEKYRKNTPPARKILEPQEIPQKIPKKYQKCASWYFGGIFSVFSGYFGRKL